MSPSPGPLRVGLLLDEPMLPWWIAPAIVGAERDGLIRVVLIGVRRDPEAGAPRPSRLRLWWRHRSVLGYALLDRLDRRRARREPLPPDLPIAQLAGARVLELVPETTRFSDRLREPDVATIQEERLDLLLRIGFRILRGPVLRAARHGVWSFHHGDNRLYRGGPPGVWEVLDDRPESGVTLQCLTEELDGGQVLARSNGATQRFSFERNFRGLLRRSSAMLLASLARLHRGDDPAQLSAADSGWDGYARPLYRTPTNGLLLRRLPWLALRYLRQRARTLGRELQWSLAWHYVERAEPSAPAGTLHRYREITPPRDRYWADPFVVAHDGRRWMFFEELRYAEPRGEIAVWEMGPGGPIGAPRIVLRRPYHLSYPQVFRYQDRWYMVPETAEEGRVELYQSEQFPDQWSSPTTLIPGLPAKDATLLEHHGHWYLFASLEDELHAFVAATPLGPFARHPANPLVSDARWERMAGKFFHSGGRLYRPAQCGVPAYGAGLAVSEVLLLTPTEYREAVRHRLQPEWDPALLGMHTLNAAGGLSVVDLLRLVRR
ncbi:MAG TPA: hypothetical protein VL241_02885 [Gemmatimonadales bacterium]|nr:hypothetical protein [Gemmatimonadales bacterium]